MSFRDLESSNQDAIPVSLYEIRIGPMTWRYASSDYDVALPGQEDRPFRATPISDSGMTSSGDPTSDEFVVTMPVTDIVELFQNNPPSLVCYLTVRRKNRGSPDAPIYWMGEVKGVKRTNGVTAEVSASALSASFQRKGLRLSYSRGCPYALYDMNCRVNKDDFRKVYEVGEVFGTYFYVTRRFDEPDFYFNGGFFQWTRPDGISEHRMIQLSRFNVVEVFGVTTGLQPGMGVALYPGCARNTEECDVKFNNLANYGGFPHMPGKDPFGMDPIF